MIDITIKDEPDKDNIQNIILKIFCIITGSKSKEKLTKEELNILEKKENMDSEILSGKEITLFELAEKVLNKMIEEEGIAYIEKILKEAEQENTVEETELVEQLFKKPDQYFISTAKVVNKIFEEHVEGIKTVVSSKSAKNKIIVPFQLFIGIDEETGLSSSAKLTNYDRNVFNACCSILEAGFNTMTSKQIYEVMTGKPCKNQQDYGSITRSMRKMMTTLLSINWTKHAEAKGYKLNEGEGIVTETNMIHVKSIRVKTNGQERTGYKFLGYPELLTYSKAVGNFTRVETKYIVLNNINSTENVTMMKHYLIRRIEGMKNTRNGLKSNRILLSTLFEACEITGDKTQMKRNRDNLYKILENFVLNEYIKAFKKNTKGKTNIVESVEIML